MNENIDKVKILNIKMANIYREDLLSKLSEGFFMPVNTDLIVKLQKDKEFYDIYKKADWVVCDSKILSWAARFLGMEFKDIIPGSSFFPAYYQYHKNNQDIKIFLLGAAQGVALKAMENINSKVGRNIVIGAHSPSYGFEKNEAECRQIIDIVNASGANVLVVGVGAPKQEKWMFKYKDAMPNVKLFMALGATIDFEAGNIKRAPQVMQKLGMEWLYRLYKEPKRLWKRYLVEDMLFFSVLLKQKLGKYKNPFES